MNNSKVCRFAPISWPVQTHLWQRLDHPRFTQKPKTCLLRRKFAVKEKAAFAAPRTGHLSPIRAAAFSPGYKARRLRVDVEFWERSSPRGETWLPPTIGGVRWGWEFFSKVVYIPVYAFEKSIRYLSKGLTLYFLCFEEHRFCPWKSIFLAPSIVVGLEESGRYRAWTISHKSIK